ncbi:hypothetical protein PROFUN_01563 [Planoprotostelium fungivorum]|uniref:Carbohydrate kinase PfkB domain-containing protein n=1 Tax=Planoprotostelium fungivorum TaxID=1890364 RepID=A0A2P6NTM6_9EUKA|nr:hypothetical protein PROFUN_01563 [Planoprotostelium fungivorum]
MSDLAASNVVIGLGLAIIDIVGVVDKFPHPDTKIRTTDHYSTGGGNAFNFLSSVSGFGQECHLITRIGDDDRGDHVLRICRDRSNPIRTDFVQRVKGQTGFSYVIIEATEGTRTNIHTPGGDLEREHVQKWTDDEAWKSLISRSKLFYSGELLILFDLTHILDMRYSGATNLLYDHALTINPDLPLLIDVEKTREGEFMELLTRATYIVASETWATQFSREKGTLDPLYTFWHLTKHARKAKFVIVTYGRKGSILLRPVDFTGGSNVRIIGSFDQLSKIMDNEASQIQQLHFALEPWKHKQPEGLDITFCPSHKTDRVIDTNGAGDSFIAGVALGLLSSLPDAKLLQLATWVAAESCKKRGAQNETPTREDIERQFGQGFL